MNIDCGIKTSVKLAQLKQQGLKASDHIGCINYKTLGNEVVPTSRIALEVTAVGKTGILAAMVKHIKVMHEVFTDSGFVLGAGVDTNSGTKLSIGVGF